MMLYGWLLNMAIEQVKNLCGGRIDLGEGRIREISSPDLRISFGSIISYSRQYGTSESVAFTIEEKMYMNSSHKTKISFYVYIPEDENKAEKEHEMIAKVQAVIDELMAGIKPEPRFVSATFIKRK